MGMEEADFNNLWCVTVHKTGIYPRAVSPQTCMEVWLDSREQGLLQS